MSIHLSATEGVLFPKFEILYVIRVSLRNQFDSFLSETCSARMSNIFRFPKTIDTFPSAISSDYHPLLTSNDYSL